jgi:signal transduction histidine kinase
MSLIHDAISVFFQRDEHLIRVVGQPSSVATEFVEVVLPQAPLKAAMVRYGLNVLVLSIIISIISAALVYLALNRLLVAPMMRITRNMLHFSQKPEDASRIITPSDRTDEVGTAERELAHMQGELASLLQQKSRLAALGLAVSKINHDLRNLLSSTQLFSDRLTAIKDPTVQRFAPKLIASLDRAINFCNDTLRFGRAAEAAPRRELFPLRPLVEDVGEGLGLPHGASVGWAIEMPLDIEVDADRDHLYRVLGNLVRNSAQAIASQRVAAALIKVSAKRTGPKVVIDVADNGPGVPELARAHMFEAFQGSTRKGGTGLGLTIAHELIVAHGGDLYLVDTAKGATFRIAIPDRPK